MDRAAKAQPARCRPAASPKPSWPRNRPNFSTCCATGSPRAAATWRTPLTRRRGIFSTNLSRSRAAQGFSPIETATFVFSLKQPLFNALNRDKALAPADLAKTIWAATTLLDELGLLTFETFQKSREEVILRQQREITELSTPVVKLWEGILALPVIGTLDSERTQVVMENLLQHIVDDGAEIAIIDITGVPTVDTLTAQHLLKTVSAARLMGADCIISGIRPQIAQTIVHLGVELNVISKATLADAFAVALRRTNRTVTKIKAPANGDAAAKACGRKGRVTMDRIPILKLGDALLVTIQVDMHDRLATALEEDLTSQDRRRRRQGRADRHLGPGNRRQLHRPDARQYRRGIAHPRRRDRRRRHASGGRDHAWSSSACRCRA